MLVTVKCTSMWKHMVFFKIPLPLYQSCQTNYPWGVVWSWNPWYLWCNAIAVLLPQEEDEFQNCVGAHFSVKAGWTSPWICPKQRTGRKKGQYMLLGAPFFNYVVDIYFCYANFLSKTSCVNFAIIRNVEKLYFLRRGA